MEPYNSFTQSPKDQIIFSKRQASMFMASMVIFCLFIFIIGYFLGKRTAINDFSSDVTQNSLHDQIDYLLTTQSLQSSQQEDLALDQSDSDEDNSVNKNDIPSLNIPVEVVEQSQNIAPSIVSEQKNKIVDLADNLTKDSQYACLIGFGTKTAANAFVARLKKHNVPVILKTIISKTAAGKSRTWYQAVTPTYDSAEQLQEIVQKVKRLEHIRDKDIKIVHVK